LPHEASVAQPAQSIASRTASAPGVEVAGVTDVGMRRKRNEDAIDWDLQLGLAMVADGMGGNQGGNVASVTALRSIRNDLRRALADAPRSSDRAGTRKVRGALIAELVRRANHAVRAAAGRDPRLRGMGTTLVMALLGEGYLSVAHVGDSRMYRLREGSLDRLTDDHTVVQELLVRGKLDPLEAAVSRNRNVITRALGIYQDVAVDVAHHDTRPGDVYMLCSDGLTGMASDADIAMVLGNCDPSLEQSARGLVELANSRGGKDNVSVVLLRTLEHDHG
jgi:protein phosphatase